jgi:hypothetical protein
MYYKIKKIFRLNINLLLINKLTQTLSITLPNSVLIKNPSSPIPLTIGFNIWPKIVS